jgi:hypothetical protein
MGCGIARRTAGIWLRRLHTWPNSIDWLKQREAQWVRRSKVVYKIINIEEGQIFQIEKINCIRGKKKKWEGGNLYLGNFLRCCF